MKLANATQTGPETYSVRYSRQHRECRFRFLLALVSAGYQVRVDRDGWCKGKRVQVLKKSG